MTRRQYKNPPIEEALCELRFADAREWDLATPARLQDQFNPTYPGKHSVQNVVSANVTAGAMPATMAMSQRGVKIQFPDAEGKRLVAVAPGLLSIHVLRPYSGWEDFRARIAAALNVYRDVCNVQKVARIGLRYINRIVIPGSSPALEEFFRCAPRLAPELPSKLAGFVHRVEHRYEDEVRLIVTFASLDADAGEEGPVRPAVPPCLLDLDLIWQADQPIEANSALELIDDMRARERIAFESLITDKLRGLFDDV
jgi:uncharacterized protein (TIGR04255 family)